MSSVRNVKTFPGSTLEALAPLRRVARLKASYTTRHVARWVTSDPVGFHLLSGPDVRPRAGDVVLARVLEIGHHKRIELPDSRRALLFPEDEIMLAYGDRYAPDQFEAEVPDGLQTTNLVAAGGLAGRVLSQHEQVEEPTTIAPVGLLYRDGAVIRLDTCAPHEVDPEIDPALPASSAAVVAVIGTSMNSGKSTTAGALVRGLTAAGYDVAAGKVTGTGAGNDTRLFGDCGAISVLDFTDFGFASTYQLPPAQVRGLLVGMVSALSLGGPDVVVLEIADGLFQQETSRLVSDPAFARIVDAVVFAAHDAAGAFAGVRVLSEAGLDVAAVSGVLTSSPLAFREARQVVGVPVVHTEDLARPEVGVPLVDARCAAMSGAVGAG